MLLNFSVLFCKQSNLQKSHKNSTIAVNPIVNTDHTGFVSLIIIIVVVTVVVVKATWPFTLKKRGQSFYNHNRNAKFRKWNAVISIP